MLKQLKNQPRLCKICLDPLPDTCEYICPACKFLEKEAERIYEEEEEEE